MNRQLTQDGGANHCNNVQLAWPSPPSNLQSHRSSPPPSPQDGGQNTTRQLPPSLQSPSTENHLPNTAVPSGLTTSLGIGPLSFPADFSDPAQVASFHPNFRQPFLASHLTKATSSAITNGEYVDFATLLPMTSLLTDTIHSHLNLKVGDQGLTILLPSSSKRPKITSIDRWLDAFAIDLAVIMLVYPSRAADLIAYELLIRDAARKFPGMAWYVYDVEFQRRASYNLSTKLEVGGGGDGTSSSTSIPLQVYPNRDVVHVAAPTISLIPALYLLVGPGMPLPNPTCATT